MNTQNLNLFFIVPGLISVLILTANAQGTAELGASCPDLSMAGIENKDAFVHFFNSLKQAARAKNIAALSRYVNYPLQVNPKQNIGPIINEAELRKKFSSVFNSNVLKAIESQKIESIFCRDQGAMLGNGEAWVRQQNGKIGIFLINL